MVINENAIEEDENIFVEIGNTILKRRVDKMVAFLKKGKFPLGTRRPLHTYTSYIPEREIVWMPFPDRRSPLSILLLATSGYKKTVLQKRICYYFARDGWNPMILEPKTAEWVIARRKPVNLGLYPGERPSSLDIQPFVPSFIIGDIPKEIIKDYGIITSKMSDFNKRVYFRTLDFPPVGTEWLISNLAKFDTPKKILTVIRNSKMGVTGRSLVLRLGTLDDDNFFDSRYNTLSGMTIKKLWRKKQVPVVSFFSQDPRYVSLYVGHLMREIHKLSIESDEFQKKIIFVDDCSMLVGKDMKQDEYLSVRELLNSITLWRSLGFMMVFATQSPGLLNHEIIADCKWFMIGRIGNPNALKDYFGNPEIITAIKNLRYVPHKHIAQYVLVHPDKITYETFYPFNPPVGHFPNCLQGGEKDG